MARRVDITVIYIDVSLSSSIIMSGMRMKIFGMNIHTTIAGTIRHALRRVRSFNSTSSQSVLVFSVIFIVIGTTSRWQTTNASHESNRVNITSKASVIYTDPVSVAPIKRAVCSVQSLILSVISYTFIAKVG